MSAQDKGECKEETMCLVGANEAWEPYNLVLDFM